MEQKPKRQRAPKAQKLCPNCAAKLRLKFTTDTHWVFECSGCSIDMKYLSPTA